MHDRPFDVVRTESALETRRRTERGGPSSSSKGTRQPEGTRRIGARREHRAPCLQRETIETSANEREAEKIPMLPPTVELKRSRRGAGSTTEMRETRIAGPAA